MNILINNDWSKFSVQDPFNPQNLVSGYICHISSDQYGALYIEQVNDDKASQLILCTPKLLYPFDKSGNWHFPKAKIIERYEKLDGTNVFAFSYKNAKGEIFVSYKTRLTPFIRDSKFGPFYSMWKEILDRHSYIQQLPFLTGANVSYELWGARNPHLVKYESPNLEASILFYRQDGKIFPPSNMFLPGNKMSVTFESSPITTRFLGIVDKDYIQNYQESQKDMQAKLQETEDGYLGQEGEVWYLLDETGKWNLFKCKPEAIEKIHWASGGIGKNIIIATCENAFENFDEPTVDDIRTLLAEEFPQPEIEKIHYSIEKHLKAAIEKHEFTLKVLAVYNSIGASIIDEKTVVMRQMSKEFPRDKMSRVFSAIMSQAVK